MNLIAGKSKTKGGYRLDHFLPEGKDYADSAWMVCEIPGHPDEGKGTIFTTGMLARVEWEPLAAVDDAPDGAVERLSD